ncbi:MAG: hypothetical protein Q8L98_04335 [Chlamydiales bacterium]|nr:hypothetical protein [Chlamydiales bacterium]
MIYFAAVLVVIYLLIKLMPIFYNSLAAGLVIVDEISGCNIVRLKILSNYSDFNDFKQNFQEFNSLSKNAKETVRLLFEDMSE